MTALRMTIKAMALALFVLMAPARAETATESPALEATVRDYCAAWGEKDESKRRELLNRVWATNGVYTDPMSRAAGRAKLAELIANVMNREPFVGARIVPTSAVDSHHGAFRFSWKVVLADGKTALEGLDAGEVDKHGRIRRLVGFFGPLKPAAETQP